MQVSTLDVENQLRDPSVGVPTMTSSASIRTHIPTADRLPLSEEKRNEKCHPSIRSNLLPIVPAAQVHESPCRPGNERACRLHARGGSNFEVHDQFPVGVDGGMTDRVGYEVVAHTRPDYPKIVEGGQSFALRKDAILYVAT